MIFQPIVNLAQICYELGVRNVLSCPGSRSAPLTLAFTRNPNLKVYSVNDERSAGFMGLGMALSTRRPVVIVCTSGSAVYNLAPAVSEAYYQQVPLVLLTADRPPEWTDQWDGQTIRQDNIYGSHVKGFFKLPADLHNPDSGWQVERMISEAINLSQEPAAGPVHLNCPFREPFYPTKEEVFEPSPGLKVIQTESDKRSTEHLDWKALTENWEQSPSKLIVVGQSQADNELSNILEQLSDRHAMPVVTDILSNQIQVGNGIRLHDSFLMQISRQTVDQLRPKLLITLGKSVISKNLKLFLRESHPEHHWHISKYPEFADPFQSLTRSLTVSPADFLTMINSRMSSEPNQNLYLEQWKQADRQISNLQSDFFQKNHFSEFEAIRTVLQHLAPHTNLHLGNSMPIRYVNLLASSITAEDVEIFGNRGTCGIDGCLSTAVGNALTTARAVVLLIGDVSFFYDRNGLWHRHKPNNLKVIMLNNQGGGIFRLIDGPASQPEAEEYFAGSQNLNAKRTAEDYQLKYLECSNSEQLGPMLPEFLDLETGPGILEITTDPAVNTNVFKKYKTLIQEYYEA